MSEQPNLKIRDKSTLRTRRYVLAVTAFLILALTATQIFLHQPSIGNPKFLSRTLQLWIVTVLVILAVLILATVLGRNLIKLYFEQKSGQVGSRFKTKVVTIFVALSLLPAVLMFSLAYWLVVEQWLSTPATLLQEDSRAIVEHYYEEAALRARDFAVAVAVRIPVQADNHLQLSPDLLRELAELRRLSRIDEAHIYDSDAALAGDLGTQISPQEVNPEWKRRAADVLHGAAGDNSKISLANPPKDVWATASIRAGNGALAGAVVTRTVIPLKEVQVKAIEIMDAYAKYNDIQHERSAVRFTTMLIFALSTLLIVFAFSWFAMYLAKRITVPIQALAQGAAAVTAGNLDYRVECAAFDEIESLVTSFNRMTAELKDNKVHIEAAQNSLHETNVQLDDRRRYIETILQAIPTGVMVLDSDHNIRTMNRTTMRMLEASSGEMRLDELVKGPASDTLRLLLRKANMLGTVVRDLEINVKGKSLHLATTVTTLFDSSDQHTGWVIVLDDLTELLRAEKMAAWQEVARRLAHEIKNPLTPIQLSAERMLNRFRQIPLPARGPNPEPWREQITAFDKLLAECVRTIICEADSLKTLVDEFSGFARLPSVRLEDTNLHQVLDGTLSLYDGRVRVQDVRIEKAYAADLPLLRLDSEQMKRVFINLFDNALEAMGGNNASPKVLIIRTIRNTQQRSVRIEISDTGRGFPKEYQDSVFLPYFSTRRGGTGLGLAIVRQVISDHHGQVRAESNYPLGTKIVIDLPLASS